MLSFIFFLWLSFGWQSRADNCPSRALARADGATNAIIAVCRLNSAFNRALKHLCWTNSYAGATLCAKVLLKSVDEPWHPFTAAKSVIHISLTMHARIISH
jgi:hypothetical protein